MELKQIEAFDKLRNSLEKRFFALNPDEAVDMANEVMRSIIDGDNMPVIGEFEMDSKTNLRGIFKKLPEITTAEYDLAKQFVSKTAFVNLPANLQSIACDE